jgi:hypothetical protein
MNKTSLVLIASLTVLFSCNDDDHETPPMHKNEPPNTFALLDARNGAVAIALKPTLTWSAATDPENDSVTYDLILDNNPNPGTVIATNLKETAFTITSSLAFSKVFYWKVIARDHNGNSTESGVFSFTTNVLFSEVTTHAGFDGRLEHDAIVFNDKMWVIGGIDNNYTPRNDVWNSSDGKTWTEITPMAGFTGRGSHTTVVYNDKIWVIGGYSLGNRNDVWSSSDGIKWTEMTPDANFSPRFSHTSVVFQNKIWVIGGEANPLNILDDVWNSTDGVNWTQLNTVGAPKKSRHSVIVFNNKIWLIAGLGAEGATNDVWNSSDGITWTQVISNAPFPQRYYHTAVVYEDKIWVIGGTGNYNELYNDVWNSIDGINWTQVTSDASFSKREFPFSLAYKNKLWVIGGRDFDFRKNDVWAIN